MMCALLSCAPAVASAAAMAQTGSSCAEGVVDVYSENSYGVCVPVNSSANEIIVGMARASAVQNSGSNGKANASSPPPDLHGSLLDVEKYAWRSVQCQDRAGCVTVRQS